MKDFDTFEQLFIELVGEYESISTSEARLRDEVRAECTRAEAAEAARDAAERSAAEARSSAAAAAAGATQATAALARAQDELTGLKMQLDLVDKQRSLLEERCSEMSSQISTMERELQQLRPLQATHTSLQRQYVDLQERIQNATQDARNEASRLEAELRRVERCASGGSELRERARLAAAAHARERKLAAAELHHTTRELQRANCEIARLRAQVSELQQRSIQSQCKLQCEHEGESLSEVRAALEAERAGSARLERALAAALKDLAALAACVNGADNAPAGAGAAQGATPELATTNICPIDSFLAD